MKIEKPYGLHRPSDPPNQQPAGVFRPPPEPPHHRPPLLSQPPTMPSWRQPPFTIDSLLRPVLLLQEPTTGHPSSPSRRPCLPTTASFRPFPPLTSHPLATSPTISEALQTSAILALLATAPCLPSMAPFGLIWRWWARRATPGLWLSRCLPSIICLSLTSCGLQGMIS